MKAVMKQMYADSSHLKNDGDWGLVTREHGLATKHLVSTQI